MQKSTVQPTSQTCSISPAELTRLYRLMVLARYFEERCTMLQRQGRINSWLGYAGQEAAILGSAYALNPEDWVFPSYREHAIALLRGITPTRMLHHLIGNSADTAKGRNLPPEYSFKEINFVSISAPVGTQIPQAVGTAWAAKIKGDPIVTITYFGDGTSSTGECHAGMNFAGVYKAPVIFFCQNNGWAISVPTRNQMAIENVSERAAGYGFPGVIVDGNDLIAVYEVTKAAADRARRGEGPTFIEAKTYRVGAHSTSDDPTKYRDENEVNPWRQRDPIVVLQQRMEELGCWRDGLDQEARLEAQTIMNQAIAEAESIPMPDTASLFEEVYAEMPWHIAEQSEQFHASR